MALAEATRVSFTYPGAARPALDDVSLAVEPGELVAILGPSGGGKSTLLRCFSGLVPHFHGGRFSGSVVVDRMDTRRTRPAELAGTVATVFQDPEDQVVLNRVAGEVAFGLENVGALPEEIRPRALTALAAVGAAHLAEREVATLSGGELQRVCLASALALEPRLLVLDEPTSQLDPDAAESFLELVAELARERGAAILLSEQRPARPLAACDRVVFVEGSRIALDAPREEGLAWLARHRPAYVADPEPMRSHAPYADVVCRLDAVSFSFGATRAVEARSLELRRGEIVALTGPNGSGKTTLAKLAAGLLRPDEGAVERSGRACYLLQDPGRYLVAERVEEEAALGADLARARHALASVGLAGLEGRHPRDLSSGERERLGLASVLAPGPDLLVLDEPTRGVDPERKLELAALLRREAPRRATLVVTHDLAFAAAVADRHASLAPERERALA